MQNVINYLTFVKHMLTLIPNNIQKIMNIFYKDKHINIHVRELSRRTGLEGPSITQPLKKLEKNILRAQKDGNLKKYSIQKTTQTSLLFQAFDIETINTLPRQRKQAIKHYLKTLEEQPIYAILFGSTAKGTYKQQSDIDILLVTNKKTNPKSAEEEVDALTGMKMSTFQITYKAFLKELKLQEDPVIQSAIKTGIPLTNHIKYYEDTL